MGHVRLTEHIDAPIDHVWDIAASCERLPEWNTNIVEVKDCPDRLDRVGAQFTPVFRVLGRKIEGSQETTKADKPHAFALRVGGAGGVTAAVDFTFTEARGGTDVTEEGEYELPTGLFAGVAEKLLGGSIERDLRHSMENFKALCESTLFLVRTDWLQGCFDGGRSCFNPYENVIDRSNAGALAVAWQARVGTDGTSSPVYANGTLLAGTTTGLVGLDPATGAIIIHVRTGPVSTTPAVIRGFDPQPDPPGKVIFGSTDGILHAVSTSGEPLWQVGLGAVPASPLVIQGIGDPNDKVIVGAGNTLFAFDGNGTRLWATVLEGGDISRAAAVLVVPDPDALIVAAGITLYKLDAATGGIIWATAPSRSPLGAPSIGDPTIVPSPHVLVGDQAGGLFSLDPRTGAIVASFAARGPISGSPAIGDPNQSGPWIAFGDGGGSIYAFDTTDALPPPIWQAALGGPIVGPPVFANAVVYVATDPEIGDPHIFALDQASGRVLFDGVLPGGLASEPIVADGRLFIATKSGDLLAYQGPDT